MDLQLVGHTHGGQISSYYWLTKLRYTLGSGHGVARRRPSYVSRGSGQPRVPAYVGAGASGDHPIEWVPARRHDAWGSHRRQLGNWA